MVILSFVPSSLQDEPAAHVDHVAVYHGDGTVCGDRGGGENISEAVLKSELKFKYPQTALKENLSEGI